MKYILDCSSLLFMIEKFPKKSCKELWVKFENSLDLGNSVSSDQVYFDLITNAISSSEKIAWVELKKPIFVNPTPAEFVILREWIKEEVFDYYINANDIARNLSSSVPFSIVQTKALCDDAILIIDFQSKDAEKIKEICSLKSVNCIDYDEYLESL